MTDLFTYQFVPDQKKDSKTADAVEFSVWLIAPDVVNVYICIYSTHSFATFGRYNIFYI